MSYSFSVPPTAKSHLVDVIVEAGGKSIDNLNHGDEDVAFKAAMVDHLSHIGDAVDGLLECLGTSDDLIAATVSGHANPGHGPHPGYADEYIQVNLTIRNG
jgi:hypothetical protein